MTDLVAFLNTDFDAKEWINAAVTAASKVEPLDRQLAELEMKLQLLHEDVEAGFGDAGLQAMRHVAGAAQDVARVAGDAAGIQDNVQRVLRGLEVDAALAAEGVAGIVAVDKIKGRMEAACSTLKEATELSGLFGTVDDVFASGDLLRMADIVATMRRSLAVVGDVPEFRGGRARLASYEAQLQARLEPSLANAIRERRAEMVGQLWHMLASTGRGDTAARLYCDIHAARGKESWDAFESAAPGPDGTQQSFEGWLPGWLDSVLVMVEEEKAWVAAALPDLQGALVMGLLDALFTAVCQKSFKERVARAAAGGGLPLLMRLQTATLKFARALLAALPDATHDDMHRLLLLIFSAFEYQVNRYGELETAALAGVAGVGAAADATDDADALAGRMRAAREAVFGALHDATERCLQFTGGTGLPDLLAVADETLSRCLGELQAMVGSLQEKQAAGRRPKAVAAAGAEDPLGSDDEVDAAAEDDGGGEVTSILALLLVADEIDGALSGLEGRLRGHVGALVPLVEAAASGAVDMRDAPLPLVRLQDNTTTSRAVSALLESSKESRFCALRAAAAKADSLAEAIRKLVLAALMQPVEAALEGYTSAAVWAEVPEDNAFGLPTFHAYPAAGVTAAGEYIMMLPQQLECLITGEGEEETQGSLAAEWLDRVANGAAELYTSHVMAIPRLGPPGAAQLSADVEYLGNVINALGAAVPAELATVMLLAGLEEEDLKARVAQSRSMGDGELHDGAVSVLCAMRGIEDIKE